MFRNSSFFSPEEALEQGQAVLKKQVQSTVQAVKTQVTGQQGAQQTTGDGVQPSQPVQDQITKDFLKDLYAPSDPQKPQPQLQQSSQTQPTSQTVNQSSAAASQTDQARLAEARSLMDEHKKRHMETYYRPTFEKRPQQEERAAEKVEREESEEKQKRWELQQEEQKKNEVPIALKMATNKAEMFRGAAG